jgi:hypothetical protein
MSLYTVMILYTMRPVTSAFTANDMKKNDVGAERSQSGREVVQYTFDLVTESRQCGDYDAKLVWKSVNFVD